MVQNASTLIKSRLLLRSIIVPPDGLFKGGVVGIDEVGRGPLAGPVVVAAVKWMGSRGDYCHFFRGIRDSKKLSSKKREVWHRAITRHSCVRWGIGVVSPRTIDRINISRAAERAALCAYQKIARGGSMPSVLLDGGLVLRGHIPQQTVIRGDEKIALIAAASIIAKVTRDRLMVRLHKKFPRWALGVHKGYGTALHRARIRSYGLSPVHRKSFCTRLV